MASSSQMKLYNNLLRCVRAWKFNDIDVVISSTGEINIISIEFNQLAISRFVDLLFDSSRNYSVYVLEESGFNKVAISIPDK